MSKRFMDTSIWEKVEFQNMEIKYKIFWYYLTSKCSQAGIWEVNIKLASYLIGETYTAEELLKVFGTLIEVLDNGKWFIKSFIPFQYGTLRETCKPHASVLRELTNEGLLKSTDTLKDKDKDKEKDKDKDKDKGILKGGTIPPSMEELKNYCIERKNKIDPEAFFNFYQSKGWLVGKSRMKDWQAAVRTWERSMKTETEKEHEEWKRTAI